MKSVHCYELVRVGMWNLFANANGYKNEILTKNLERLRLNKRRKRGKSREKWNGILCTVLIQVELSDCNKKKKKKLIKNEIFLLNKFVFFFSVMFSCRSSIVIQSENTIFPCTLSGSKKIWTNRLFREDERLNRNRNR